MAILLHQRKDSAFPKEEASAVSNQETNFVGLKVFLPKLRPINNLDTCPTSSTALK